MEKDKRNELINLYDIYNSLLTDKQRLYFEEYYYNDLSLSEISENYDISRNAVFDQLNKVEKLLISYEEKLHLKEKYDNLLKVTNDKEILNKIEDILWGDD